MRLAQVRRRTSMGRHGTRGAAKHQRAALKPACLSCRADEGFSGCILLLIGLCELSQRGHGVRDFACARGQDCKRPQSLAKQRVCCNTSQSQPLVHHVIVAGTQMMQA